MVHAEEIAREQRRFITTGTGTHFEHRVSIIILIFRQKQDLHFVFEIGDRLFQRVIFLARELCHVGVIALHHRFGFFVVGAGLRKLFRLLGNGAQFGMLFRQRNNLVRIGHRTHTGFDFLKAVDYLFEAVRWNSGHCLMISWKTPEIIEVCPNEQRAA